MNKIEKLHNLARLQNRENELPDFLLERILLINEADDEVLDELIERIEYFNNEVGMGCFSEGYSVNDIEMTLKKVNVK